MVCLRWSIWCTNGTNRVDEQSMGWQWIKKQTKKTEKDDPTQYRCLMNLRDETFECKHVPDVKKLVVMIQQLVVMILMKIITKWME